MMIDKIYDHIIICSATIEHLNKKGPWMIFDVDCRWLLWLLVVDMVVVVVTSVM